MHSLGTTDSVGRFQGRAGFMARSAARRRSRSARASSAASTFAFSIAVRSASCSFFFRSSMLKDASTSSDSSK